jgi:hypothetical protein
MPDAIDPTWLNAVLSTRLPRRGTHGRLALVPWSGKFGWAAAPTGDTADGLWACLQLVVPKPGAEEPPADGNHGSVGITVLVRNDQRQQPHSRVEAYLDGWLSLVEQWLTVTPADVMVHAIPANLACAEALSLAKPRAPDDFRQAMLAPRRLGKLFGDRAAVLRVLGAGR